MITSKTSICNLALASVGAKKIISIDEDAERARFCKAFYDATRTYLLGQFDWPFARKQAELAQLTTSPDWIDTEITYAYQLPSDCLLPLDLLPEGNREDWEIRGNVLYCSVDNVDTDYDVILAYVSNVVNETLFSPSFVNILAVGIAVRLAPVLSGDKALTNALFKQYEIEKNAMFEVDANIGNKYLNNDDNAAYDPFVDPDMSRSNMPDE